MADKTEPGAFNLPLYLAFSDPMYCAGLILSPTLKKGFKYLIMDVSYTRADKVIELVTPEEIYDIAILLREPGRFVVESIFSRATGEQVVSASTTRLHNIAGKYVGKDDPVMIVRTQKDFPATGEILAPYALGYYVSGFMRGSHIGPLMPVKANSTISFFDGPPVVSCLGFSMKKGKLTGPVDCFDHPFWDYVRKESAKKAIEIRKQGFYGAAMLPMSELEYTGVVESLKKLEKRFKIRK
jgi:fructose 1,6-bisphosphate aldolase/phosphatase